MITLSLLCVLGLGAMAMSVGVGLLAAGLRLAGGILRVVLWVLGLLFVPFGLILATAYGIGFLLPALIPVALVLFAVYLIGGTVQRS